MEKQWKIFVDYLENLKEERIDKMLNPSFIRMDLDAQTTEILFYAQEWEKNLRDELHGGVISSMFDVAMGVTAAGFKERTVTTAELHVSFIKPFCSEAFVFSSQIMSMGNTLIRTAGIAREKDSKKIVATATGTFVPLKK
ncbi:PaaI family thioesterase [bacterium 1XD42-8]|jgi:uncharacterized protein (TIGR00369 family)|nr:PaaI family thioesterase [bacterium 1XD42-8]